MAIVNVAPMIAVFLADMLETSFLDANKIARKKTASGPRGIRLRFLTV
jgi:hypothetical protein